MGKWRLEEPRSLLEGCVVTGGGAWISSSIQRVNMPFLWMDLIGAVMAALVSWTSFPFLGGEDLRLQNQGSHPVSTPDQPCDLGLVI